jgi:Neutral/alkaline non-lysosomal ceramidase, N-terminal
MNQLGTATVDITPPDGLELVGYGRGKPHEGVHDRLRATSFYITDGGQAVSYTSIDHAGCGLDVTTAMRERIADRLGLDRANVFVVATHTHSGPFGVPLEPRTAEYLDGLARDLADAAARAADAVAPCTVSWSVGHVDVGENRREITPEGNAIMGRNPDGVVDRRLGTLRFIDPDTGTLRGLIVVTTAHANVLKHDWNLVSGDYPGAARRLLEGALDCPVIIAIGSAGDINARWRGTLDDVDRMARGVAAGALEQLAEQWDGGQSVSVAAAARELEVQLLPLPDEDSMRRQAEEAERNWQRDIRPWFALIERERERGVTQPTISMDIAVARIGDFTIGGVPAETFAQTALDAAASLGSDTAFLCGYTNGCLGYLPTAEQYAYGGYEVLWNPVVWGHMTGLFLPMVPETAGRVADAFVELATRLHQREVAVG